jgi:hypothetical protein
MDARMDPPLMMLSFEPMIVPPCERSSMVDLSHPITVDMKPGDFMSGIAELARKAPRALTMLLALLLSIPMMPCITDLSASYTFMLLRDPRILPLIPPRLEPYKLEMSLRETLEIKKTSS